MNRTAPGFGATASNGTRRSGGNWLPDRLARIVRRSDRKGPRVARAHGVALSAGRPFRSPQGDPPDRLRRAGLI